MKQSERDDILGFEREIFQRRLGELRQLDSSSDAGLILDSLLRGHLISCVFASFMTES